MTTPHFDPDLAAIYLRHEQEAERAARLLATSLRRCRAMFPLTGDTLKTLGEDAVERLDAFRVRLTDLQDCLGNKVFRALLALEEESAATQLDRLNAIEKRGLIASFETWKQWREVRNALTHDYPEHEDERSAALNQAFVLAPDLIGVLLRTADYVRRTILTDAAALDKGPLDHA